MTHTFKKSDYVLATKYHDADPLDHWAIGFYDRQEDDRHFVVDGNGDQFRGNGFRRVKKISSKRGDWILKHKEKIEHSGRSVYFFARCKMVDFD